MQTVSSVKLWKQTKNCTKILESPIKILLTGFLGTDGNRKHIIFTQRKQQGTAKRDKFNTLRL